MEAFVTKDVDERNRKLVELSNAGIKYQYYKKNSEEEYKIEYEKPE